jgi:hypothetical protein
MNYICHDVLNVFFSFIAEDKDTLNLIKTCKNISDYSKKQGFLKKITITPSDNPIQTYIRIETHKKTLKLLEIQRIADPELWIPFFPEITILDNCMINKEIDPPNIENKLKELIIIDPTHLEKRNEKDAKYVNINWKKFPNLKIVSYVSSKQDPRLRFHFLNSLNYI